MIELGAASAQAFAISTGSASPQNMLRRNRGYDDGFKVPSFFIKTAVEGTENQTVRSASLINCPGLIRAFSVGQHTHAPRSHATNMSATERSKVMSNICENRSCSVMLNRRTIKST